MELTVHRGSHEIGGTCIELKSSTGKILLDCGLPLTKDNQQANNSHPEQKQISKNSIEEIPDIFYKEKFDALLISHAHPDHYGLMNQINKDIPVFMSKGSRSMISVNSLFSDNKFTNKIVTIFPDKKIRIKDFVITPFLVDHSCIDSLAFLIEVEGKRLFYTGDFRGHGRNSNIIKIFFVPNGHTKQILNTKKLFKFRKAIIKLDEICNTKQKMLIKDSYKLRNILRVRKMLSGNTLIYSQWSGYLSEHKDFWKSNNVKINKMHISGHAYYFDIKRLINAVNPKYIIPVHTECPEIFNQIADANIIIPQNGQTL